MDSKTSETSHNDTDDKGGGAGSTLAFLVVGVGASAGGLEAFGEFLANTPSDADMAFVLVQHLDPTHDSVLVDLLARYTALPVVSAEHGARLTPNCVHVIPPDATLTIADGYLQVERPAPARADRRPIDTFFESLAVDQGENAVGIVLSGSGTDGSRGIHAIKSYGGLALAQAESDHQAMSGMPQSAVTTGDVDYILSAGDMGRALVDYARNLLTAATHKNGDGERGDVADYLSEISALVRARTGHDFSEYKDNTRIRRVQRRMQVRHLDSIVDYVERLRTEPAERDALFREFLICVTRFFRDPEAWTILTERVLPTLLANKTAAETIRIWVPGCASGEEAYSVAVLFAEALEPYSNAPEILIFATDIDDSAAHMARKGWFAPPMSGLSTARRDRWFTRDQGGYRPVKAIRDNCIFSAHDLSRDPPFSRLDLIICRNLLIYMQADLQERILRKFHYGLRPDGYLFLGLSENVGQNSKLFSTIDKKHRIFQRQEARTLPISDFSKPAPRSTAASRGPTPPAHDVGQSAEQQLDRDVRHALAPHCPAYMVVDQNYEVLRFSGATAGAYLEPSDGAASFNLFAIVKKALRPAVRAALKKAFAEHASVVDNDLALHLNGRQRLVTLIVEPIAATTGHGELCVVAFRDSGQAGTSEAEEAPPPVQPSPRASEIEQELRVTQTQLAAANAELGTLQAETRAATEEYQSVNEELQSSNEELETSKEEMQSINEEVQTVNAELTNKNEHLTRLNSDLQNLLESTEIATIFLDDQLCIKNFTPGMADLFRLRDTDMGRPITDIASRLDYHALKQDVESVLRRLAPVEREVRLDDGSVFVMTIRLYRTITQVIDGVVITFFDITARKRYEAQRAWLAAIVEYSRDAIISQDPEGAITSWNAAAEQIFGYSADEAIGRSLHNLIGRDAGDESPAQLENRLAAGGSTQIDVIRLSKSGHAMDVALTISPIVDSQGERSGTAIVARDISERVAQDSQRELLVRELSHRVKNALTTVQSIMMQTLSQASSPEAFRDAFTKRIQALANTHNLLSNAEWNDVQLLSLVEKELRPYGDTAWRASGTTIRLSPPTAIALGLALHELATNAAKYGALSINGGWVAIDWERVDAETETVLRLGWVEHGGPAAQAPEHKGFGLRMIQDGLAHQLQARVELEFASEGMRCTIELPLPTSDPSTTGKRADDDRHE